MDRIEELLKYALHYTSSLHQAMEQSQDRFTAAQIEGIGDIIDQLEEFRNEIE